MPPPPSIANATMRTRTRPSGQCKWAASPPQTPPIATRRGRAIGVGGAAVVTLESKHAMTPTGNASQGAVRVTPHRTGCPGCATIEIWQRSSPQNRNGNSPPRQNPSHRNSAQVAPSPRAIASSPGCAAWGSSANPAGSVASPRASAFDSGSTPSSCAASSSSSPCWAARRCCCTRPPGCCSRTRTRVSTPKNSVAAASTPRWSGSASWCCCRCSRSRRASGTREPCTGRSCPGGVHRPCALDGSVTRCDRGTGHLDCP